MAVSMCVKCNSAVFELREAEPRHSNFVLQFVQCANCGAVVGVLESKNISASVAALDQRLQRVQASVNDMQANIQNLLTRR